MADIFVSYKKEDAGRVVRIVEGLREEGFTVWWDHGIAPGDSWDQMIQRELDAAKVVIAVWSELSVDAPWVKEEAMTGKHRGALVPVRIDAVEPPLGFGLIQFADLIEWDGDIEDKHWDFFIESIKATIDGRPVEGIEKPPAKRKRKFLPWVLGLAGGVVAVGAILIYLAIQSYNDYELSVARSSDGGIEASYSRGGGTASEAEQKLFDTAQETRLKEDYQDYIRSFPQGVYARKIREEILPLCEGEMRPVWKKMGPHGQMQVSTSSTEDMAGNAISWQNEADACASAKDNYQKQVEGQCRSFAAAAGRNPETKISWAECDCNFIVDAWFCTTSSTYACTWETLTEEYVEVCG